MVTPSRHVHVVQHTDSEYLGRIEDHLEGRGIRFSYLRPHHAGGWLPPSARSVDGLFLLGGGPWGTVSEPPVPVLERELALVRDCLEKDRPVVGIGLGAQVLALAAGGGAEPAPLACVLGEARRVADDALAGFLPARYPLAVYMRDRPLPPPHARVLAVDGHGHPALFQVGASALGFSGHPGAKSAMFEDLVMEFEEAPPGVATCLEHLRAMQGAIEDALVPIMTGLVAVTGLMGPAP